MDDILEAFRGDPDGFEVTRPMKYLLGSFGVMLAIIPISLYIMHLDEVSEKTFLAFTTILMADLILMVVVDVLIVLIWMPCSIGRKRDNSCSQSLPMQPTSESAPSDTFKDITVGELTRRLEDLHDKDEAEERRKNSSTAVCTAEVHKSTTSKSNVDQDGDFSKPEQIFGNVKSRQVSFNPQRRCAGDDCECVGDASSAFAPNQKSASQKEEFHRHFSVPKGFWFNKKQQNVTAVPHQCTGDCNREENTKFVDAARSRRPIYVNLDQSGISHGDGFDGYVEGQKNMNPSSSQQGMTELKKEQNSSGKYARGVNQSNDVGRDKNGASSTKVSERSPQEDGSRKDRYHKRFWTDPQPPRDSAKREEEVNQSSESLDEMIKNRERELERSFEVQPTVRGSFKRRRRYNYLDYETTSFRRRRYAKSSVPPSNIDDALELVPISYVQSKLPSTSAWVFDSKNAVPYSEAPPPFKRHRSAPSKPRRGVISSPTRSSSNRLPIPTCDGDNRHRVLHRLLATILTSGDDDTILACPELESSFEEEKVPKMEVEALPSGDYVLHMSMRLTCNELQNFKSRRATIVKDSEFKKYLSTLSVDDESSLIY